MYVTFVISGLALLVAAGWLVVTVDDWSRDLTTNSAATSLSSKNPRLHPIVAKLASDETADRIIAAAGGLRGWSVVAKEESPGEITLRLVRTTQLWRFRDDITVHV